MAISPSKRLQDLAVKLWDLLYVTRSMLSHAFKLVLPKCKSHKLPKDTGCWLRVPRQNRMCTMCQQGVLGDEKHLLFECPALQDLRDRYENLFQAP